MNTIENLGELDNNWYIKVNNREEFDAALIEICHHIALDEGDVDKFVYQVDTNKPNYPLSIGLVDGELMDLAPGHSKVNEVVLQYKTSLSVISMILDRNIVQLGDKEYYADSLKAAEVT